MGCRLPGTHAWSGSGEVDPFRVRAVYPARCRFQCRLLALRSFAFQVLLDGIQHLADAGAFLGRELAEFLADLGELALASQRLDADGFHRIQRRCAVQLRQRAPRCSDDMVSSTPLTEPGPLQFQVLDHILVAFGQRQIQRGLVIVRARRSRRRRLRSASTPSQRRRSAPLREAESSRHVVVHSRTLHDPASSLTIPVCRLAAAACSGMLFIGLVDRAFTCAPVFSSRRAASVCAEERRQMQRRPAIGATSAETSDRFAPPAVSSIARRCRPESQPRKSPATDRLQPAR